MFRGRRMARAKSSRSTKQSRNDKSVTQEQKTDTLTDYETAAAIQLYTNQKMYDLITMIYKQLLAQVETGQATGILVTSLSSNLGIVLGQITPEQRTTYINISTNIMQQSLLQTIETIDTRSHGQIGHA